MSGAGSIVNLAGSFSAGSTSIAPITIAGGFFGLTGTAGDVEVNNGRLRLLAGAPRDVTVAGGGTLDVSIISASDHRTVGALRSSRPPAPCAADRVHLPVAELGPELDRCRTLGDGTFAG